MGVFTLGKHLAPSFEDPIAMLLACHGKIRRFGQELQALPAYVAEHGWDEVASGSVQRICHYFNVAAPLHHADEELDLFLAYAQIAATSDVDIMQQLTQTHHVLEQAWQQLAQHLQAHPLPINPNLIEQLNQAYAEHMALEEPLFGRAQQQLQADVLHRLGQNMAGRRK